MTVCRTSDMVCVVRCYSCKYYSAIGGFCEAHSERDEEGEWWHKVFVCADHYCADGEQEEE